MIANETTIHQSLNEVDLSNKSQSYSLQPWQKPIRIVGNKRSKHEKYETIQNREKIILVVAKIYNKIIYKNKYDRPEPN